MATGPRHDTRPVDGRAWLLRGLAGLVLLDLALVGWGLVVLPSAVTLGPDGPQVVAAQVVALLACAAAARWGPLAVPRWGRAAAAGAAAGLVLGLIVAAENVADYVIPLSSTAGAVLGGLQWVIAATAAAVAARVAGLRAAVWSAIVGYLLWLAGLLIPFLTVGVGERLTGALRAQRLFDDASRGTPAQVRAYALQDYLGSAVFHLLFGVALAALTGLAVAAFNRRRSAAARQPRAGRRGRRAARHSERPGAPARRPPQTGSPRPAAAASPPTPRAAPRGRD